MEKEGKKALSIPEENSRKYVLKILVAK